MNKAATPTDIQEKINKQALDKIFVNKEKPFICKGKHRYIEVIKTDPKNENIQYSSWVCQCGRNMKD